MRMNENGVLFIRGPRNERSELWGLFGVPVANTVSNGAKSYVEINQRYRNYAKRSERRHSPQAYQASCGT